MSNTRANVSINQTDYYGVPANFTINISILNSSNNTYTLLSQILVNTTSGGIFMTKSGNYQSATPIYAPLIEGKYELMIRYDDTGNSTLNSVSLQFTVLSKTVDKVRISTEKARYYANDSVIITGSAWTKTSDILAPVSNISLNGTLRRKTGNVETVMSSFSCTTGDTGTCSVNLSAPADSGKYIVEVNNFMASSSFHVVPFDVSVYIKDSTGTSFKEILTTNEQASVEVKVTKNGTVPTGTYIFNGTITDSGGRLVANITSTKLNDTNGFINRFQFTTTNEYTDGIYKAAIDVYETGGSNVSSASFFQVRSWTLYLTKASGDSGFEYEYSAFPERNVTFEIYPKERANGTVMTVVNYTHFNITLYNGLRQPLATANTSLNSTCGTQGCYKFFFTTPNITGTYVVSVTMNFSSVIQTAERTIKVTDTTASAFPSTQEGSLKELFSTTEFVFISISGTNTSGSINITNATIGSIIYENGTEINYTRVGSWANVDNNNSALEWAFNDSVDRLMLDAPKQGGAYTIKMFLNNNTASASTSFIVNPYDSCAAAKSSAGSVDSSSSWYVWQYKSTDTVYIELRLSRAQNPSGRAPAENASFGSQYGMGMACYVDTTTKQVITNATLTVDKVVNMQSGAKQSLNSTATLCSSDNDQGQYTCTIKPESKWSGGRSIVYFKIVGPDGQTTDRASTIFESRSFYIWAYSNNNAWIQKPVSNITFSARLYEAGSNWWSSWYSNTQNGGITGSINAERVNYMGDYGEWLWPPIDYKYNTTGLNTSNVTNGWGTFTIYHDRTPKSMWQTGTYSVTVKGTNDATGESDYGEAWFSVRQWEAYSSPIEAGTLNYKDSFNSKENISLYVRIYTAGNWNDNGGASLGGNVTVGVKKLSFYQAGSYKEVNSSVYNVTKINVNVSSPWYWGAGVSSYKSHILNISRITGSWDGGWYNVVLDINGTETGYGWFNVIPFNIDTQPVNASGVYTYTATGTGPVYFNISTTKNKKNQYYWYTRGDYINTTIKDMVLRTWKSDTWQSVEYNYPEDFNISPMSVNGTALVMVNKSTNWDAGYYYGEVIMADSEGSTASGYLWFSIQPFRVSASTVRYTVDIDGNATVNLNVYQPDWSNNNLVYGNYSITSVTETMWSGSGYSKITYNTYKPSSTEWFNATTQLNITPNNNAWSLANGGYRYITIKVTDNNGGSSQTTSISFRAVSIAVSVGSVTNQYSITSMQNVTLPITVTKAISGAGTIGNLSKVYEWNWPYQTVINFSIGSCNYATTGTCMINSTRAGGINGSVTQNVTLIAPSGGWTEGWHSLYLEFTSATDRTQKLDGGYAWFNVVNPYAAWWYSENENASWSYYVGLSGNITFRPYVMNASYGCGNAYVNVSKVELAASSNNCWSDYCMKYYEYNFTILNQTSSGLSPSNTSSISAEGNTLNCSERRVIKVLNNGTNWERGYYHAKVYVNGSQGTAVLKGSYLVYVKDTTPPNATINSPAFNTTVNGSLFFNATTSEAANCYVTLLNYDAFRNWYCSDITGNASNTTADTTTVDYRACMSTNFNGTAYYYAYVSKWYSWGGLYSSVLVTGGTQHTFNFSISKLPAVQDYGIDMWCYDEDWNYIHKRTAFRVNFSTTISTVNITLLSPANNTVLATGSTVNMTIAVNHSDAANDNPSTKVANCTLYTNFTGTWAINDTRHNFVSFWYLSGSNSSQASYNVTNNLSAGTYKWNVICNATGSAPTWAPANYTFTIADLNSNINLSINQSTQNNASFTNSTATAYARLVFNISVAAVSNMSCQLFENISGLWAANISGLSVTSRTNNQFIANFTSNISVLWNVYCSNGTQTAWGQNRTFNITVNNANPSTINVSLESPANGASVATGLLNLTFRTNHSNSSVSPTTLYANCTLYTNFTGTWAENQTHNNVVVSNTSNKLINFTPTHSTAGTYSWGVLCNATGAPSKWSSTNRTFVLSDVNSNLNLSINQSTQNVTSFTNNTATAYARLVFNISVAAVSNMSCQLFENISGVWAANISGLSVTSRTNNQFIANFTSNISVLWNIYCSNGTQTAWGQNRTFNITVNNATPVPIDTIANAAMNISLESPANSASQTAGLLNLSLKINHSSYDSSNPQANCTLYTNFTGTWAANLTYYHISANTRGRLVNFTPTHSTAGTYLWGATCSGENVSSAVWTPTNRTLTLTAAASSNVSNVSLESPADGAQLSTGNQMNLSIYINMSTPPVSLNCTLHTNLTGVWAENQTLYNLTNTTSFSGFTRQQSVNFTLKHSIEGAYLWGVQCNATNMTPTWSRTNRTFTLTAASNTTITVNLSSPANNAFFHSSASTINLSLDVNASILTSGTSTCDVYTNSTGSWALNMSRALSAAGRQKDNLSINISTNMSVLWNVLCGNSTVNAWGSSNRTFKVAVNNGSSNSSASSTINVTLLLPANGTSQLPGVNTTFQFNWSGTATSSVNCSLYTNFTSSWAVNSTANSLTSSTYSWGINQSTAAYHYVWNVFCTNSTDTTVSAWAPSNFTWRVNSS